MKRIILNQIKSAVIILLAIVGCAEKETRVEVASVSLNTATIEMVEGDTFSLMVTVLPKDAEYDGVTWASSNASVASVNYGTVTAHKVGTATITASAGGKSSTCIVKVSAKVVAVTSIILDKSSLSMQVGESVILNATVKPDNATDKNVIWGSSDVTVATVSDGKVTAKKSGNAIITAKSGSCIAECTVTVTVNTEAVTIDKTSLSLAIGETATLTATVKPDNATDKSVVWTSSDESVAKVANGKVTAIKSGKATITASCGGKTAECVVTVTVPSESVTLDKTTLSLAVGETAQLTATVKPDNATDKNVVWTSSDESVAKVTNGKVTAIKSGNATITASCGGKTAECAVTVIVPVSSVILDKTVLSLSVGETATLTATVTPDNASDKVVVWTSSVGTVAKVVNGQVTALKSGTTTITAKCGGKAAYCVVTVIVPVSSVALDRNDLMLPVGDAVTLVATVKPDNATSKSVKWSSTDESVATVNNGNVVAVKEGNAIISASAGEISSSCKVVVINSNRVIKYTAESAVTPFNQDAFGAKIIANEYSYPNGTIFFDDRVTEIGRNAFYQCQTIKTIDLPETVSTIGDNAFMSCRELKSISIPESVASIGIAAFKNCTSLSEIDLPNMLTAIEKETFYNCMVLSVVLPKNVKTIGERAFVLTGMKTLDLPRGIQSIGKSAFTYCDDITNIVVPDSVVSIGDYAFTGCDSLISVEIEGGVTVLSQGCFCNCPLLFTVKLPNSIQEIRYEAFSDCPVLSNLYLKASMPPKIGNKVFDGYSGMNIWVPRTSVDAYKEKWSNFKDNIKAYDF